MFPRCELVTDRNIIRFKDDVADDYVDLMIAFVEKARLNDLYPSSERLVTSLSAMDSSVHRHLYNKLHVHPRMGLPTYTEFVRVLSDKLTLHDELPKLRQWEGVDGDGIYDKLARKRAYLGDLARGGDVFTEETKLLFRKIDPKTEMAMFRIILDRFSPNGSIERLTVELSQRDSLWGKSNLELDGDDVGHLSENLKGLVYRLSTQEVEIIFIRLSEDENIDVENVTKGSIGPVIFSQAKPAKRYSRLHEIVGDGAVFSAALQVASVEQVNDVSNDPFSKGTPLSAEAREQFYEVRSSRPYHVLKDRKFVSCEVDKKLLVDLCAENETKNIIYEV
ncbi:MAG: hypothetical protein GY854_03565 [Deltaproteobacteria bacterium]|nr:hypothetical protein [Deltaproteobacteria bacterium]